MSRREDILGLLATVPAGLDDDEIGHQLGVNRVYVNQVCRGLAREGRIARGPGPAGKLVNRRAPARSGGTPAAERPPAVPAPTRRHRSKRTERARRNVDALIVGFPGFVRRFERSNAFPGPSLYFHKRAIGRRRQHRSVQELLGDELFFEYVYAVLPAWGMHRMGNYPVKVGDFRDMLDSFQAAAPAIGALWDLRIVELAENEAPEVARQIWDVLKGLRISRSRTRIVAGSKALHHVLPDLVPPIDRQYTFQFFTGQRNVATGDERAFLEWFPYLAEIGRRTAPHIDEALSRGGFMATGPAKVIDNAIIGFMQGDDGELDVAGT